MYQISFDQTSNSEDWTHDIGIVAADDGTPIDTAIDGVVATVQVVGKTPRGFGDQSQSPLSLVKVSGNLNLSPSITVATNDGTGQLALVDGLLTINVPASVMEGLKAGYYQVGIILSNPTAIRQIAVGLLPVYDGGASL